MTVHSTSDSDVVVRKSKQERIRDNQRRSRARRQEYLADLERRLKESHVAHREAVMQRTAFAELQVENTRLRYLLNCAGISPDMIEAHVRSRMSAHAGCAVGTIRPQIKSKCQPQLPIDRPNITIRTGQVSNIGSRHPTISRAVTLTNPAAVVPMNSSTMYGGQHPLSFIATPVADTTRLPSVAGVSSDLSFDGVFGSQRRPSTDGSSYGDTFSVTPNGSLLADDGNTISAVIDPDNPAPTEATGDFRTWLSDEPAILVLDDAGYALKRVLMRAQHPNTPEAEAQAACRMASRLMGEHNVTQAGYPRTNRRPKKIMQPSEGTQKSPLFAPRVTQRE